MSHPVAFGKALGWGLILGVGGALLDDENLTLIFDRNIHS